MLLELAVPQLRFSLGDRGTISVAHSTSRQIVASVAKYLQTIDKLVLSKGTDSPGPPYIDKISNEFPSRQWVALGYRAFTLDTSRRLVKQGLRVRLSLVLQPRKIAL